MRDDADLRVLRHRVRLEQITVANRRCRLVRDESAAEHPSEGQDGRLPLLGGLREDLRRRPM